MLLVDIKTGKIVYLLWLEDSLFILVINTIEDLLLLVANTCTDPLDIKILITNIIKDLLLAVSTYKDILVLEQITYT
jgi:hypothetical protein